MAARFRVTARQTKGQACRARALAKRARDMDHHTGEVAECEQPDSREDDQSHQAGDLELWPCHVRATPPGSVHHPCVPALPLTR